MSGSGDGVLLRPTPPPAGTGLPNLLLLMVLGCIYVEIDGSVFDALSMGMSYTRGALSGMVLGKRSQGGD